MRQQEGLPNMAAIQPTSIAQLRQYLDGIFERSRHHAPNIAEVIAPLFTAVLRRADKLWVFAIDESLKNLAWAKIGEGIYAFSYHHGEDCITIRRSTKQGEILARLTNATPVAEVLATVEAL